MDEELIRNNELIAAYLDGIIREGWRVGDTVQNVWEGNVAAVYREAFMGFNVGRAIMTEQLKFHSSWDWLMPVVRKIEQVSTDSVEFEVWIMKHSIDILYSRPGGSVRKTVPGCAISFEEPAEKLSRLYQTIVTFIKWYNEQHDKRTEGRTGDEAHLH